METLIIIWLIGLFILICCAWIHLNNKLNDLITDSEMFYAEVMSRFNDLDSSHMLDLASERSWNAEIHDSIARCCNYIRLLQAECERK